MDTSQRSRVRLAAPWTASTPTGGPQLGESTVINSDDLFHAVLNALNQTLTKLVVPLCLVVRELAASLLATNEETAAKDETIATLKTALEIANNLIRETRDRGRCLDCGRDLFAGLV